MALDASQEMRLARSRSSIDEKGIGHGLGGRLNRRDARFEYVAMDVGDVGGALPSVLDHAVLEWVG